MKDVLSGFVAGGLILAGVAIESGNTAMGGNMLILAGVFFIIRQCYIFFSEK